MSVRKLQLTLALFKPDIIGHPHIVKEVKKLILKNNFYVVRSKILTLSREKAAEFYKDHEGKFFHRRLVTFMSSGPISANILARENGVAVWREVMGPTKVFKTIYAEPETIRGRFGLTDTRNCTHGSDSEESAKKEIGFFFPDFDIVRWYENDGNMFFNGQVIYKEEDGIHIPDS